MPRKPYLYHYVYKTTCQLTSNYYIGIHSTSNLEDGYLGSGKRLRRSIYKHGKHNHSKEILEFAETRELVEIRETELINLSIGDSHCINLTGGGTGFKMNHTTKSKNKISTALSNKTYEEIHGIENAENERNKRRLTVKKDWENIDPVKKIDRLNRISSTLITYFETHQVEFKELVCPYCNATGKTNGMYRWHFENCKNKIHGNGSRYSII